MAVSFVAAASSNANAAGSTGVAVTKPSGLANGDVLIAHCSKVDHANTTKFSSSGWTDITPGTYGTTTNNDRAVTILRKVVTDAGSEPSSYTFAISGYATTVTMCATVSAWRGASTVNPVLGTIANVTFGNNDATPATPNATTTVAGAMAVTFHLLSMDSGAALKTVGAPSGWTTAAGLSTGTTAGTLEHQHAVAYRPLTTPGATAGTNSWTHTADDSSSEFATSTILLCPATVDDPADFANLTCWIDAQQEAYSPAASVTTITDRSGNGRNWAQDGGSPVPTFAADALGSFPAFDFNGTTQYLRGAAATALVTTTAKTVVMVAKVRAVTAAESNIYDSDQMWGEPFQNSALIVTSTHGYSAYNWDGNADIANRALDTNWHVFSLRHDGTNVYGGTDGTETSTASGTTTSLSGSHSWIGAGAGVSYANCQIAEAVWFNRALAANELAALVAYLNAHWSEPSTELDVSLDLAWDVRAEVEAPIDLWWGARTEAADDLDLPWAARVAVDAHPAALQWATRAAVAAPVEAQWDTRAAVAADTDLRWDAAAAVAAAVALEWAARAAAQAAVELPWDVRAAVLTAAELLWQVQATAVLEAAVDLAWDVRATVAVEADLLWDIRAEAADTIAPRWAARAAVDAQVDALWGVRAAAEAAVNLLWNVAGEGVFALATLRWATRAATGPALVDLRWAQRDTVDAGLDLTWEDRARLTALLELGWVVESLLPPVVIRDRIAGREPARLFTGREPARLFTGREPARLFTGREPARSAAGREPVGAHHGKERGSP